MNRLDIIPPYSASIASSRGSGSFLQAMAAPGDSKGSFNGVWWLDRHLLNVEVYRGGSGWSMQVIGTITTGPRA